MWEINSATQIYACAFAVLLGLFLSLVYDIIKASRKIGFNSYLLLFLGDIFFSFFSAVITFMFLLIFTNGALRGFVIIFEFIGFVLWRLTVSRFFLKFLTANFFYLKKFFRLISALLLCFSNKTEEFFKKIHLNIKKTLKKSPKTTKKS